MSEAECREYTQELRRLAASPQSLGKKLRLDAVETTAKATRTPKASQSYEDMLKELGG